MALKSEIQQTPNGGSKSVEPESHFDEDLEDGEIIEEDFDEEPPKKPESQSQSHVVDKNLGKDQRRAEPKAINNYGDNFPSPAKRPKNNFKKSHENWNDRPFNKDKPKKPFNNVREDEFRFKKKRKKQRKDEEFSKSVKKPRTDKGQGNSEGGELDDDEDLLFVRGASPSADFGRNNTTTNTSSSNYDETETGDEEDFSENNVSRGRGRGSFGGRHMRGSDRRSRPPMRGMGRGKRGRGGIMRKGKDKDENQQDSICRFYMQGKCLLGDYCPYSHDACPPKKMELCKFYLMDCCAKRDKCLYMHNDFPCKYYHTNLKCFAGKNCKFSHGKLNDQLRTILIKHIETAPKEILGEFPRIGREGAIAFLKSGGVRNPALDGPDDYRGSPIEQNNHTPVPSPSSMTPLDSDVPSFSNENFDDRYGSNNFSDDKFSNRMKPKNKKEKKWKNGKKEERHHRKEDRRSEKDRHRREKSKDRERDGDRDKDERRSSKHSPRNEGEYHQLNFYESTYGYNPNISYEQYNQQCAEHTQEKEFAGDNQGPETVEHPQESIQESTQDQTEEQSSLTAQERSKLKVKEEEETKEDKAAVEAREVREAEDKLRERDEILNNMPKKQRELFLRIQQHQRDSVAEAEKSETEEMPKEEENWYSSDEEEQDKEPSPLSAILRTLQFQPSSNPLQNANQSSASSKSESQQQPTVPENQPPPLVIPSQFESINISDEVTKLLSSIRSQTEQKTEESQNLHPNKDLSQLESRSQPQPSSHTILQSKMNPLAQSQSFPAQLPTPKVRDPRLSRTDHACLSNPQSSIKKEAHHTPINIPLKRLSTETENSGMSLMDIDLRLPNPELNDPPVSVSSGDVDLRHLPFKPAPIHQAATEIEASISSHPSIPYRLTPIDVPKIDYSNIVSSTKGGIQDPRLRPDKPTVQSNISEETPLSSSHAQHVQPSSVQQVQSGHTVYPQFAPSGGFRDPRKASGPMDPRGPLADPRLSTDGQSRMDPRMDPRQRSGILGATQDPRIRMHVPNAPAGMPGTPIYDEDSRTSFNPNFNPMMQNPFNMDSDLRQMMNPMQCQPGMRMPFDGEFPGGTGTHHPRPRADPRKAKEDPRKQAFHFSPNQQFDGDVDLRVNQIPRYNYSK